MALPDYQTLMLPVLRIAAEGETTLPQVVEAVASEFGVTSEERELTIQSGTQTLLYNRVAWAKTYLAKAGLVQSPRRGVFEATTRGRELLASGIQGIDATVLRTFGEFREWTERSGTAESTVETPADDAVARTPEETIPQAIRLAESRLSDKLLQRLVLGTPAFFERVIVDVLVGMGYGGTREDAAQHLGMSGDRGVDGVVHQDMLGLDSIYLQAKRYAIDRPVAPAEIREFLGALVGRGASKGVFVTTSTYSTEARKFAAEVRQQRVVLIDGQELARIMIRHGIGVRITETFYLRQLDADFWGRPGGAGTGEADDD